MTKIAELKARLMKDPAFRVEYEKADAEFARIEARAATEPKGSPTSQKNA
jgi:hypothetical protein